MSIRSRARFTVSIFALAAMAGSAQGAFFSFASDNTHTQPTFLGSAAAGGSFTITSPGANNFSLLLDDNNGARQSFATNTRLVTNLTATSAGMSGFGSFMTYSYAVTGNVDFVDPGNGNLLMRITIGPGDGAAVMTVPGTATQWGTAGAVIGSDSFSQIDYTITEAGFAAFAASAALIGETLANYQVFAAGGSGGPDDFGFTLTALMRQSGALAVTIDSQTKLPNVAWKAESSYSGSTGTFIPTPGGAALLAAAGLLAARRRRA